MNDNVLIALKTLETVLETGKEIQQILRKAQEEGRDITKEELDHLRAKTDAARRRWDEAGG